MSRIIKITLASLFIAVGIAACKKTQDESAQAAKETITEIKASTIDAANEAATKAEQVAQDIAEAADSVDSDAKDE